MKLSSIYTHQNSSSIKFRTKKSWKLKLKQQKTILENVVAIGIFFLLKITDMRYVVQHEIPCTFF